MFQRKPKRKLKPNIPLGPEDLDCPFWREPMVNRCHWCPLWTKVTGKHPQTGADIDKWDCAIGLIPITQIENSMMQRQTGAAIENFRNEVVLRKPNINYKPMFTEIPQIINTPKTLKTIDMEFKQIR